MTDVKIKHLLTYLLTYCNKTTQSERHVSLTNYLHTLSCIGLFIWHFSSDTFSSTRSTKTLAWPQFNRHATDMNSLKFSFQTASWSRSSAPVSTTERRNIRSGDRSSRITTAYCEFSRNSPRYGMYHELKNSLEAFRSVIIGDLNRIVCGIESLILKNIW